MPFQLIVPSFPDGGAIPQLHTRDGADLAPALEWSGEPPGTRSFALIVDDPDAPRGVWTHWLLWDIPPHVHALAQGFVPGRLGRNGSNDFGRRGYGGPAPPRGHGPHRYFFRLLALSAPELGLAEGASRAEVDRALEDKVLARAAYMGRYERK